MITVVREPVYSFTGAWIYTRLMGWLPVPGTQPLPPCKDVPIRFVRLLTAPRWTG